MKRLLIIVVLALGLPTMASSADEELSLKEHLRIDHEHGGDAYFFVAKDQKRGGFASLAVSELASGERAFLSATVDLKEGIAIQRFEDHSTGWSAELIIDMGMRHIAEPGMVGGGSTSDWLAHVVELTTDPATKGTITVHTSDGSTVSWPSSGQGDASQRQEREDSALEELGEQLAAAPPPLAALRAVAFVETLISENSDSMFDHFEDLVEVLVVAFDAAGFPTLVEGDGRSQKSIRVSLTESEDEVKRMRRSLKSYVRTSLD